MKNNLIYIVALFFALLCASDVAAQTKKISLREAFTRIEKSRNLKFFYRASWIQEINVDELDLSLPLEALMSIALNNSGFTYRLYKDKYVILVRSNQNRTGDDPSGPDLVNEKSFLPDGNEYTISGKIREANTGESVVGASVYIQELKSGTVSNTVGYYSITLPSGVYSLQFSATGKAGTNKKIFLDKNTSVDVDLFDHLTQLNEVVVQAEAMDRNISSVDMGLVKLDLKTMQSIPAFMGETDIIKSITLLPGVSTVGEGAGGFNVRGGSTDQNLILVDDVPVFNSSHLFGFFSIINSDDVKDMTLYKGGIPSQFGGRISSVLDITLKDGNTKEIAGNGGVGIISSKLSLEGPIIKDKLSFVVGGRYAYPNWILKKVPDYNIRNSEGYFYDLNATLNYQVNEKNSIRLSSYYSNDGFKFAADTIYGWSTHNATLKWNTLVSEKFFLSTTAIYSNYKNSIEGVSINNEYYSDFGIKTIGGKIDGSYFISLMHKIDFGVNSQLYHFNPGTLIPSTTSSINSRNLQPEKSIESGIYINDEIKISQRITLLAGLRYSLYSNLGPSDVLIYDPDLPRSPSTVIDTLSFDNNEIVKSYSGVEPRASLKLSINNTSSVKLSYNRTLQYLHLISNTTAISPIDVWKPSNYHIKPQIGDQYSIGYFKNLKNNSIETSVEFYYKEIQNLVDYKDGAELFLNPFLDSELLNASGLAYGAEIFVRKNTGKLTGWLGYTYSRSFRKIKGSEPSETVNGGEYFPSNFDKPNDVTAVINYKFTKRLSFSSNFTYSTGRPITYPNAVFIVDGYSVVQFAERNQDRIPDYHRLDLAFTLDKSLKQTKKWKGSWTFSIYNIYGRKNPYSIFFQPDFKGSLAQAYRLSVLGTVFPSLSYNFKF